MADMETIPAGGMKEKFEYSNFDAATIYYHIGMLIDAGLVKGKLFKEPGGPPFAYVDDLTWTGHDFLDAMRDDNLWNKAKEKVIKPGVSFTFDLLLEWLKSQAKQTLGLS